MQETARLTLTICHHLPPPPPPPRSQLPLRPRTITPRAFVLKPAVPPATSVSSTLGDGVWPRRRRRQRVRRGALLRPHASLSQSEDRNAHIVFIGFPRRHGSALDHYNRLATANSRRGGSTERTIAEPSTSQEAPRKTKGRKERTERGDRRAHEGFDDQWLKPGSFFASDSDGSQTYLSKMPVADPCGGQHVPRSSLTHRHLAGGPCQPGPGFLLLGAPGLRAVVEAIPARSMSHRHHERPVRLA